MPDRPAYRAQIQTAYDPARYVDGGLFGDVRHAVQDAERLTAQYGTSSRVLKDGEEVWRS